MSWRINFSDGTSLNIVGSNNIAAFDTVGYSNCVLAIADGVYPVKRAWTGKKTDLDGRTWEIDSSGRVIYHGPIEDITVTLGGWNTYEAICCFYVPINSTNGFYIASYPRQDLSIYVNGADGTDLNWAQAVAEYPDDRKINFLTGNFSVAYYSGNKENVTGVGGALLQFEWFTNSLEEIEDETDPYAQDPDGIAGTGGGTGSFDGIGDDIDFPSLPALSAVDTGLITLFNPSASQLKALANYLWGDLFDIDTWKKIFADPMDAILGMSIVPVAVPDGGAATVTVGNISTGISMNRAARQYVEIDCGTLNVNEYWGAYLDYSPYTKAEIYLPYIGTHPLETDDIMNKSVHVKYHIDILSGACCAYVKCGGSVMYSFVGQCSCSIPITGNDWTNVVDGALSIAASIGTMVATGGANAPMAASTIASTAVNTMKPSVEKSGSMGGMGGMLGVQTPYLILTRPRQALPARQNRFTGYPSFITMKLSDCSGYTEIESVHLENISATEQELSEIESLLKGGVIL